jgi:hypothetical protein
MRVSIVMFPTKAGRDPRIANQTASRRQHEDGSFQMRADDATRLRERRRFAEDLHAAAEGQRATDGVLRDDAQPI